MFELYKASKVYAVVTILPDGIILLQWCVIYMSKKWLWSVDFFLLLGDIFRTVTRISFLPHHKMCRGIVCPTVCPSVRPYPILRVRSLTLQDIFTKNIEHRQTMLLRAKRNKKTKPATSMKFITRFINKQRKKMNII